LAGCRTFAGFACGIVPTNVFQAGDIEFIYVKSA
jgi:hypothetical protein